MDEYEGQQRPLPWPLRNPLIYSTTTEADSDCSESVFVWPEDSDERIPVVFNLSLNEFVVLASSIDVGSDIAYGVDGLRVWWLWDRVLRCPVSICAQMVECITSDEDVRAAIRALLVDAISNDPATKNAIEFTVQASDALRDYFRSVAAQSVLDSSQRAQSLLSPDTCEYGYLFTQVTTAVTRLDDAALQLMTVLSPSSSPLDYANLFMNAIPIIGSVIPTALIEGAATALHDFTVAAYESGIAAMFESLRCGIWCLIKDDCYLSIDRLIEYYTLRSGFVLAVDPFDAFRQVIEKITEGSFSNQDVAYLLHLLVLNAIRMKQKIFDLDFGYYALDILAAAATSNDGWEDCNSCDDSACFSASNFSIGSVFAQSGGSFTVITSSNAGEEQIVWNAPDPVEGCHLVSIDTLVGVYTSYEFITTDDESIQIWQLPAQIKYVYMAKPQGSPMTQRWIFD